MAQCKPQKAANLLLLYGQNPETAAYEAEYPALEKVLSELAEDDQFSPWVACPVFWV